MGVYPYITAQIILQLLQPIIPALERKMQEDPRGGRIWMEKWTVFLTIPMAALSAIGQINIFNSMLGGNSVLSNFGFTGAKLLPTLASLFTMIAGTMLGVWLGQLIDPSAPMLTNLPVTEFQGVNLCCIQSHKIDASAY